MALLNTYIISKEWFDWTFDNSYIVSPVHTAIYFWTIELCNRLKWKEEFEINTLYAMTATGIRSKNTYFKAFHDLVEWGFIEIVKKSKNQNTPNIVKVRRVIELKNQMSK